MREFNAHNTRLRLMGSIDRKGELVFFSKKDVSDLPLFKINNPNHD